MGPWAASSDILCCGSFVMSHHHRHTLQSNPNQAKTELPPPSSITIVPTCYRYSYGLKYHPRIFRPAKSRQLPRRSRFVLAVLECCTGFNKKLTDLFQPRQILQSSTSKATSQTIPARCLLTSYLWITANIFGTCRANTDRETSSYWTTFTTAMHRSSETGHQGAEADVGCATL